LHGPAAMDAQTIFRLATIEGAKALHIENETGSVEPGKKADLVLLDLNEIDNNYTDDPETVYSKIVYSSSTKNVHSVMIDGEWVVKNNASLIYDKKETVHTAKNELKKLLARV